MEIDSDGNINVYIMNDEQWDEAGGLVWEYLIRWKDIEYLSGLTFDITVDDDYYIVFYNKNLLFSRTIQVDVSIEYKSITITSPTSTDTFLTGYNTITWTTTGNFDYVKIQLYNDGVFLESFDWTDNDGSYSWYIYSDEYTDGSNYQIRISDYYDDTIYYYSDYFAIKCETKTLTITSPMSPDIFLSGYNYITWTTTGDIDYVEIDLYRSGVFLETLSSGTDNDGSYSWYIYDDEYINVGGYYQIKISDYYDSSIYIYGGSFVIDCEVEEEPDPEPDPDPDPDDVLDTSDKNYFWNILLFIVVPIVAIALVITIPIIIIRRRKEKQLGEIITKPEENPIAKKIEIPKIIYCRECGAKVNKGKVFCSKCGTKQ